MLISKLLGYGIWSHFRFFCAFVMKNRNKIQVTKTKQAKEEKLLVQSHLELIRTQGLDWHKADS
jgi:hypothetical protein